MSSAYDDIKRAFEEMKSDGSKITKNAVATRAKTVSYTHLRAHET